jgi:hypothetical protein
MIKCVRKECEKPRPTDVSVAFFRFFCEPSKTANQKIKINGFVAILMEQRASESRIREGRKQREREREREKGEFGGLSRIYERESDL